MHKELTEAFLQQANAEKLAKAKEYLGEKWLLHPSNSVPKAPESVKNIYR